MNFPCPHVLVCRVGVSGFYDADFDGWLVGNIDTDFTGYLDGYFCGVINGDFDGTLNGTFTGTINGIGFSGTINQVVSGAVVGYFCGRFTGTFDGNLNGYFEGYLNGHVNGDLNGQFTGRMDGLPTDPDLPFTNYSAEKPDVTKFFGFYFPPGGPPGFCESLTSQALADLCAGGPDGPPGQDPPIIYFTSSEQTCSKPCGINTYSYTYEAGHYPSPTQAQADAQALAFACSVVDKMCEDGGNIPPLFNNTAQTCSVTCPSGAISTYIYPPGAVSGFSQASADAQAYAFACDLATILCPPAGSPPPVPPGGGAGAEFPPPTKPPPVMFSNAVQFCESVCPDGGIFKYRVPAGMFFAISPTQANAMAKTHACEKVLASRFCLSQVGLHRCVGEDLSNVLQLSGVRPANLSWVATGLPSGMNLSSNGTNGWSMILSGTPSLYGIYQPSFKVTDALTGNYLEKTFTITVAEIITSGLANGVENEPYSSQLQAQGFIGDPVWSIFAGSLPDGLSLSGSGAITGTPTTVQTGNFEVQAVDSDGNLCLKELSLEIEEEPANFPLLTWDFTVIEPGSSTGHSGDSSGADINQRSNAPFGPEANLFASGAQALIIDTVTAFLRLTYLEATGESGADLFIDVYTDQGTYVNENTAPAGVPYVWDSPQFVITAGETNFRLDAHAICAGSGFVANQINNFRVEIIVIP